MTRAQRRVGMTICFLTIVLAILDQNIVNAAIVPIATDLDPVHGLERISWVVTAFSLAATAVLPLYGRLCDVVGPARVFVGAVSTFVLGSVLCGTSQNLTELIAFRALQGIGAGGLISVAMVVVAHLTEPGEGDDGGGPSGMAGIIFGVGMTVGPPVGGVFADHGIWRWVFLVNVPLGLTIILGALVSLRIPHENSGGRIDFLGAALAAAFASCVLLVCDWGGDAHSWTSPTIIGLAVAAMVTLALFLRRQATAQVPILPLSLFRSGPIRNSYLIQGLVGMALMGVLIYLLEYLQVVRGVSAARTGTFLAFLAVGITVSGFAGARLGLSLRVAMTTGTGISAVVLALLSFVSVRTSLWVIRGGCPGNGVTGGAIS